MDQRRSAAEGDTLAHGRIADTAGSSAGFRAEDRFEDRFDDEDYPAYSMGAAAEMLGVSPTFLRALGAAKLIEPKRSSGGHRRYSRYQLRLAARARELVDQGTPVEAACRIIILEDQLAEALRINNARDRPAGH
ncbi:helix-turn-helix domain-containing protein [Planotetraspora sp. GP83]|uniref:helix-turn-helix domain-containing protein n=1 Tax=Planotetraspora sp. GP83 TaxID=3156264 RepID=UPI00351451F9